MHTALSSALLLPDPAPISVMRWDEGRGGFLTTTQNWCMILKPNTRLIVSKSLCVSNRISRDKVLLKPIRPMRFYHEQLLPPQDLTHFVRAEVADEVDAEGCRVPCACTTEELGERFVVSAGPVVKCGQARH